MYNSAKLLKQTSTERHVATQCHDPRASLCSYSLILLWDEIPNTIDLTKPDIDSSINHNGDEHSYQNTTDKVERIKVPCLLFEVSIVYTVNTVNSMIMFFSSIWNWTVDMEYVRL
jgi:hypothetical protein